MNKYLASFVLLLTAPAVADNNTAMVESAFSKISDDYYREWAFTESTIEDDMTFIGHYDPRLDEDTRWNLLSVDGREPTADEAADYQRGKKNEFRGHNSNDSDDVDMIKFDTLALIEETDEYRLFSFEPRADDDEGDHAAGFMRKVKGTLKIVRDGNYLAYIDLRNDKPVRPAIGVKISRFRTHLAFGPAAGNGPIVPLGIDVEVKGRAMLFVKFDEQESIRYSDYEYVGPL